MTNALNLTIIEGRVVRTPDLLYTKNGHAMCKFDLAINETYKSDNEFKTLTSFISISMWDKMAESFSKYLDKGKAVRVIGGIKQNNWEDQNNKRHSDLYINATNIEFLDWSTSSQK